MKKIEYPITGVCNEVNTSYQRNYIPTEKEIGIYKKLKQLYANRTKQK